MFGYKQHSIRVLVRTWPARVGVSIRKMTSKAAARVLDHREVWCILTRFKAKFTKQSQGFAQEEQ